MPWCTAKAERCDLDHRIPHARGGATCACNVGPLCRRHHRQKSAGELTSEPSTDPTHPPGTMIWITRTGQRIIAYPYAPLPPEAYVVVNHPSTSTDEDPPWERQRPSHPASSVPADTTHTDPDDPPSSASPATAA